MDCEIGPLKLEKAGDGSVRYFEWYNSLKSDDDRHWLSINTFNSMSRRRSKLIKSKYFKEIDGPEFNVIKQDKKGNRKAKFAIAKHNFDIRVYDILIKANKIYVVLEKKDSKTDKDCLYVKVYNKKNREEA